MHHKDSSQILMRRKIGLKMADMRFEVGPTLDRTIQLAVAVQSRGNADQARVIVVASFCKSLTCRYLGPERLALWSFWVIVDRVWSLAEVVRYRGHLDIVVGHPVTKHDRCEIDSNECVVSTRRRRPRRGLLVLIVNHACDVRRVRATVTLSCKMEGQGRVLGETGEEEF